MKIKLNVDLLGLKSGSILTIKDSNNVPIDLYWRRRLIDSKTDNCIEIISNYKKKELKASKENKSINKEEGQ